jgi:hypothetical protein
MSSTLIPACPLCGLRFANRPLFDLHIREDHRQRNRHAEPDHNHSGDPGDPARETESAVKAVRTKGDRARIERRRAGTGVWSGARTQDRRSHPSSTARASRRRAVGLFRRHGLASRAPRTTDEVIAMTAARRPRRPRSGWPMTVLRPAVRTLRYANQELVRASEAIYRSARAPQLRPRPDVPAGKHDHAAATAERADRAA